MTRSRRSPQQNLKELKSEWYRKLKADGFKDIERPDNSLKEYNSRFARRSKAFQNHEMIREFFLKLDLYLVSHNDIKPLHRKILQMYTEGIFIIEISRRVKRSYTTTRDVIRKYKKLITDTFA